LSALNYIRFFDLTAIDLPDFDGYTPLSVEFPSADRLGQMTTAIKSAWLHQVQKFGKISYNIDRL
jgi:hypothetical protein